MKSILRYNYSFSFVHVNVDNDYEYESLGNHDRSLSQPLDKILFSCSLVLLRLYLEFVRLNLSIHRSQCMFKGIRHSSQCIDRTCGSIIIYCNVLGCWTNNMLYFIWFRIQLMTEKCTRKGSCSYFDSSNEVETKGK